MTTDPLEARAERLKVERLLHRDDGDLGFLATLPPEQVRVVRERITDLLFEHGTDHFDRLLAASRLLPTAVSAAIAQRVFSPVLCAQMAGRMEPDHAAGMIRHFDVGFVAELSAHVDPRTVGHLIPQLPDEVMVAVAAEIVRRGDHLTAGRLVGHAPERVLPAFIAAVEDERDLLEIAFFLEDRAQLDRILSHLDDDRLQLMIESAERDDLWPEALTLVSHLGKDQAARVQHAMFAVRDARRSAESSD